MGVKKAFIKLGFLPLLSQAEVVMCAKVTGMLGSPSAG